MSGATYRELVEEGLAGMKRRAEFWAPRLRKNKMPLFLPGDCCTYCCIELEIGSLGPEGATWDHVVPISRGGADTHGNLVLACRHCNSSKCARDTEDFAGMNVWKVFRDFDRLVLR